jgi:transcriptional regulator with XRE-family HTH domain
MKKQPKKKVEPLEKDLEKLLSNMGKRMQELRKKSGYKNYELFAYENELPRAQYGRYERGQDLKLSSLLKVVRGYGITINEFFSEGFE